MITEEQVNIIAEECALDNWDDEGSVAVKAASLERARLFIKMYGELLPPTGAHFYCSSAGEVTVEWATQSEVKENNALLVIYFGGTEIEYFHILGYMPQDIMFSCETRSIENAFKVLSVFLGAIHKGN